MSLKNQIITDMTAAMKAKEPLLLSTLRMMKAEIMKHEVSGENKEATDEIVLQILQRGVKQRKEAIEGFEKGGNAEAAQQERDEIVILERYLPTPMPEAELRGVVQEVIEQMKAGPGDMGRVMGAVMGKVGSGADGGRVKNLVKELLG